MSRGRPSYARPSDVHPDIDVHPRPLAPLGRPPAGVPLPPLPSPARDPIFASVYTLSTHLYPSAYPHGPSSRFPRSAYADRPGESKEARLQRQEQLAYDLWQKSVAFEKGEALETRREVLWNAVNRFVRNDVGKGPRGITLFLAHANGFHKETWEPWLLKTFSRAESAGVIIDEVWAFESIQHGDSALVNDSVIGDVFDWADNARDILNFLLHYLPSAASSTPLPTHLRRVPDSTARERQFLGFGDRTVVCIGHSLGGCTSLRAAIEVPLFSSIILVDPIIVPRWSEDNFKNRPELMPHAVKRRANWNSREEALAGFQKSPFFQAWDSGALKKYVEHALTSDPDGPSKDAVRLKMSGAQEAVVFASRRVCYETWQLMPSLDKRIEVRFIMSGKDNLKTGGEDATREMVWRCRNASNVRIPSADHLIPQEDPEALAEEVVDFLGKKYGMRARL